MLQALVSSARRLLDDLARSWQVERLPPAARGDVPPSPLARVYRPLERVMLTDGVGRTLFEEYAAHRAGNRGDEETGWVLLGVREAAEAVVLATLPAGTQRNAGVGHVQFDSRGQALASRIVRQADKRVVMLGVVHTHPGSLRHPSDGDYRGDSQWVGVLRGGEGVFGIGTADGKTAKGTPVALQPRPNVQCYGELSLSWYALGKGDRGYRPLPVGLTLGPDLARPLHRVWAEIEEHTEQLDRLLRQQAGTTCEVVEGKEGPALAVTMPLAEPNQALRVLLEGKHAAYFLLRNGEALVADPRESRIDRGVYLLLADLVARAD